ncbi:long-chain fatty acid outer membrane transporter [Morganella morganii]|uniref:Long-chain fatty acid transport protein n=1 Tax=Morganella morganii TaxID=582 RepID=A0A0D8LBT6_MORMO|nr:long-chain fatty acid transporter FadL [Morganella morganii]KJF79234.1 long-chain fatty acid outer membrane transporter [Morganella morganii]HDF2341179.1 long-chain fatty acid transporter FadL [Morganella morganii]
MNQKNLFTRSALAVAVSLTATQAFAAGFQLNEYSTSALGRAFSGEGAVADDASVGSRNPAAMTLFDRPSMSAGAIMINPSVDISGKSPLTGNSTDAKDIAPSAVVPNLHFIMPINEKWSVGASTTTNFGLATEFKDNYSAGAIGGKTDLVTANFNVAGAYRLNDNFSFGLGLNAVYADAEISRHTGELGQVAAGLTKNPALAKIPANSNLAKLKGDGWGYGWNAGMLYELDKDNRFSLTYRSKVTVKFKDGDFTQNIPGLVDRSTKGKLDLNLPDIWEFSAYHRVAPKWAVHYTFAYTGWDSFRELKATDKGNGDVLFEKHEGFKNAYRVALGTTYYHDDNWTFRGGIAFDDSPVPANNRSISIPDQDRIWFSLGSTYAFNKDASVDVGVAYMHGRKVNISEPLMSKDQLATIGGKLGNPNLQLPNYEFSSSGKAWLYGVNFNYSF